jgi:DNA polymerase elongation subunit (family B)
VSKPRILILDIETSLMRARLWSTGDQYIRHNQIEKDWHLMAWAAKWLDEATVHYMDQRKAKDISDDSKILKGIWKLMDEADVIVYQNGDKFDRKRLNTRFILNGLPPPSSYQTIDTLKLAKKNFDFTSNKLEYLTEKLNKKYKKLSHEKYPGELLWLECEKGNIRAWNEMKKYNQHDVLSTEELYKQLLPYGTPVNFAVFTDEETVCQCGSRDFSKWGFRYVGGTRYQRLKCNSCGAEHRLRIKKGDVA